MEFEKTSENKKKPLILIVDDIIKNLQVIGNVLIENGYEITMATRGAQALGLARAAHPDLILLDVMMPDMDGFETCTKFKESSELNSTPIIFLTAKTDTESVVKGFEYGGVDYISKPFNSTELLARVKTHIELKHSRDIILEQNQTLKNLVQEKNEFMKISAHDLRDPVAGILGHNEILRSHFKNLPSEKIEEITNEIEGAGKRMQQIIRDLLDINEIEQGNIKLNNTNFNIELVIEKVIKDYEYSSKRKRITISYTNLMQEKLVFGDKDKIEQVLDNLISNAIKFSPFYKQVWIKSFLAKSDSGEPNIVFEVKDEGPGLSNDETVFLFQKFAKLSAKPTNKESSTGLGLSIVKSLVDEMGGKVWCESKLGYGSSFKFSLPI